MLNMCKVLLAVCLFVMFACGKQTDYWKQLESIEQIIESRPDSALIYLRNMDIEALQSNRLQAKYSLLLSMSLDKNFIDKLDFEILQPAIDYYSEKGTATDKLRMRFYQGRIFHNLGDISQAMSCYLQALDYADLSEDKLTEARTLIALGNIYHSMMEWEKVCQTALLAANIFLNYNRLDSYVTSLLKAVNGFMMLDDNDLARHYLELCRRELNNISSKVQGCYYSGYLTYLLHISAHNNEILCTIEQYKSMVAEEYIDHSTLANCYIALNDTNRAYSTIRNVDTTNVNLQMRRYSILYDIYRNQGCDGEALSSYIKFNKIYNKLTQPLLANCTDIIEQNHQLQGQTAIESESKRYIILCAIIAIILLISMLIYIKSRLQAKTTQTHYTIERYKILYRHATTEQRRLSELLQHNTDIDDTIKNVIKHRLILLNKFFTVCITNKSSTSKSFYTELDNLLANRSEFMSSTRLAFMGSNPQFISYLQSHKLTDWQIEYCCLYALGLNGKEIGTYLKKPSHYNISSEIRSKLGLVDTDTNLSIYLKQLLENTK